MPDTKPVGLQTVEIGTSVWQVRIPLRLRLRYARKRWFVVDAAGIAALFRRQ